MEEVHEVVHQPLKLKWFVASEAALDWLQGFHGTTFEAATSVGALSPSNDGVMVRREDCASKDLEEVGETPAPVRSASWSYSKKSYRLLQKPQEMLDGQ